MAKKVGARNWGSIRELPSGNFQIRYPDPFGVYRNGRVTFTKKRLAEQELENIRIAIQKNTWSVDYETNEGISQLKAMTLTELGERWRAQAKTKGGPLGGKTKADYEGYVTSALRDLAAKRLYELTTLTIDKWLNEDLKRGKFPYTKKVFRHLRQLLTWAVDQGWLTSNPTDKIKGLTGSRFKPKKTPSVEQVRLMISNAPSPEFKLQLALIAVTALRPEEIYELRRKDLEKITNAEGVSVYRISISRAVSWLKSGQVIVGEPKGNGAGYRILETGTDLTELIRAHLTKLDLSPEALLFPNGADPYEHKKLQSYRYQWDKLSELAGYDGAFYSLRRYAITQRRLTGATEAETMAFGGHTSLEVAMTYQANMGINETKLINKTPKVI
jgi:integrase